MAGPWEPANVQISTVAMRRILQYEPRDLTISVEAGMPFAELNAELARNGQMIPLDGPYEENATVGGMVAANISGARRRIFGTARDLVIGMRFATVEGKLVDSGGMVVKNVAGLDMAKLMIGSFGTLAAIASVNFKLTPRPAHSGTVLFTFDDARTLMAARDAAIRGVLNPVAVEALNPALSAQLGLRKFQLAMMFGGNQAAIERSLRESSAFGPSQALDADDARRFWSSLHQFTPRFLAESPDGAVARISLKLSECGDALGSLEAPALAHAATGVVRGWFTGPEAAAKWLDASVKRGWKGVVEFSAEPAKRNMTLWPEPGGDFAIMKEIKHMFDPESLLNRGRLYGRI